MPPKKRVLRTAELECIDNGHRFTAQVWHWAHFVEGVNMPVAWSVISTEGVRCPECGSRADVAKG